MKLPLRFHLIQVIHGLAGFFLIFILLTGAIPLLHWTGIHGISSKTRSANLVRIFTAVFFLSLVAGRRLFPSLYNRMAAARLGSKITESNAPWCVTALFLIYLISGISVSVTQHLALETRAFDLGIFAQAVWNTTQGNLLFSSLKNNICLLGDHFSPLLALLAPFYALAPDPRTLVVLQALTTASCIPLVYHLGRKVLDDPTLALMFALAFFLYLPGRNPLREDFHPEVLAEPLMFLAFLFLMRNRIGWFLGFLLLILSAKENMSGVVFVFGFYTFCFLKKRWLGFALMLFSAIYLMMITGWVIPAISGQPYLYGGFYRQFLASPWDIAHRLLGPEAISYIFRVFSPLVFLSAFHPPTFVLTLPVLLQNLLSDAPVTRSLNYHYTAGLSAFVFISAIYGWKNLQKRFAFFEKGRPFWIGVMIFSSLMRSGPSGFFYFWNSWQKVTERTHLIREELGRIGPSDIVLTHNNLIPQVANRRYVYQFDYHPTPSKAEQVEALKPDVVVFAKEFWEPATQPLAATLEELLALKYKIVTESDGFFILKRQEKPL